MTQETTETVLITGCVGEPEVKGQDLWISRPRPGFEALHSLLILIVRTSEEFHKRTLSRTWFADDPKYTITVAEPLTQLYPWTCRVGRLIIENPRECSFGAFRYIYRSCEWTAVVQALKKLFLIMGRL